MILWWPIVTLKWPRRRRSQGKYLKSKWHYEGKGQEWEGFLTCEARRRLVLTLDGDKTSVQERSSNIFNFWKRGNSNISNRSLKAMNLTSHGVKRNLMAKFVWTLDLAAESYGANTWFGAGKSSYNARADCSKMQKTNNMDSGLQMEDQLGLLIMRTELGWNHSSAEVKLSMNKADFKGLRTKQIW